VPRVWAMLDTLLSVLCVVPVVILVVAVGVIFLFPNDQLPDDCRRRIVCSIVPNCCEFMCVMQPKQIVDIRDFLAKARR
jgi:hypothetical protein